MAENPLPHNRSARLDALRGLAVLGMIIAHGIFFFHNNTNPVLVSLEQILNTTVFTLFVFVSGLSISRFMDTHSHTGSRGRALLILKRAGLFYIAYAVSAVTALLTTIPVYSLQELIAKIFGALTLLAPPSFTEYLPLFILLTLSLYPLWKVLHITRRSVMMTVITGGLSYVLGILLFPLALGPVLGPVKELVAGGGTTLRFPLLFYFPVFLWGLWWQFGIDHGPADRKALHSGFILVSSTAFITIGSIVLSFWYYIPLLDVGTRWPPSIAYLTAGLTIAITLISLSYSMRRMGQVQSRIFVYLGRDALDLWLSHLLLLFVYRRVLGVQFGSVGMVCALIVFLLSTSIALSSVTMTNRISFPMRFTLERVRGLRIRYIIFSLIIGVAVLFSLFPAKTGGSAYGNFMFVSPLSIEKKLPSTLTLYITSDRKWYVRHRSISDGIDISVSATDNAQTFELKPDEVKISIGKSAVTYSAVSQKDGTIHYFFPVNGIPPGEYPVTATTDDGNIHIHSNTATISVSEPFLVAWTFDWEGWDASDTALKAIGDYSDGNTIRFTHFVNPRMFLPGILTDTRRAVLTQFLKERLREGDEIALHMHMQFDLVRAAGVNVRTTHPWGLLTSEGYDVPTTEYTPEEFRTILTFSKNLLTASGMPMPRGFRAGGWFMNGQLLKVLSEEKFAYDSSGRDRPVAGPFRSVPWDLPVGAQPYIPSEANIYEIPDNGVSTSESTSSAIIERARNLYPGGILTTPKTFVVVSHPQFATQEFSRIPDVLSALTSESEVGDRGPVMFVTMYDIYNLWTTSYLH